MRNEGGEKIAPGLSSHDAVSGCLSSEGLGSPSPFPAPSWGRRRRGRAGEDCIPFSLVVKIEVGPKRERKRPPAYPPLFSGIVPQEGGGGKELDGLTDGQVKAEGKRRP